ncbi:DNA polymerase alpha-binding protein [[Candida] anglica]|uniref:DNA polymerase alpha-binding protein n=1 Tax=[Candida] anglica TaxID=148631 RepID=A0ABP0EED5_9ASCO
MENTITAFPDGHSHVVYDGVNSKFIVGNSGGLIKVFKPSEPDLEPESLDIAENISKLVLSTSGHQALVATLSGKLELVDLKQLESTGDVYRSELPLRDAVYINEGKRVVVGGDDSVLVVVDLQVHPPAISKTNLPNSFLNASYNPTGEMLAVSTSGRHVQIYSVINEMPTLLETIKNIIPERVCTSMEVEEIDDGERVCTKTEWSPNGELLLVSSSEGIDIFNRSNFTTKESSIPYDTPEDSLVDFALSPNGKFVAQVWKSKSLYIYNFDTKQQVEKTKLSCKEIPINVTWGFTSKKNTYDLFVGTSNGDIISISDIVEQGDALQEKTQKPRSPTINSLFLDEADESGDEGTNTDDLLDGSDADVPRMNDIEDSMVIDEDDDEEEAEQDQDVDAYLARRKRQRSNGHHPQTSVAPTSSLNGRGGDGGFSSGYSIKPYSPGSTPWNSDKSAVTSRRYLSMNSIGYTWAVKSTKDESNIQDQQSITISFFDRAVNKDYHFTDYYSYDLCSMNTRGVLLGCSGHPENNRDHAGRLYYRHHESLQDSWDRKIPLLKGEFITSITLTSSGDDLVVVGTNFGYVRYFNLYGVCVFLMKTTPVVTLISSGSIVFIVNQSSSSTFTYSMLNAGVDYRYIQQDVLLPLRYSPSRLLIKGIFFNEHNDPCIVPGIDDTVLILSNWRETHNGKWIPILNLHDSITEGGQNDVKKNWNCWPLGLYKDEVSCLILKSGKYPGFPLPLPVEVTIEMPVSVKERKSKDSGRGEEDEEIQEQTEVDTNKEDPEELFLRALTMGRIVHGSLAEAEDEEEIMERLEAYSMSFDKSLLKIFAKSCQDTQLSRAYSVAKLIKTDKALFAASKIAERMEFISLATRIAKLREDLLEDE